jgi:tetratricopeptide (TPR) repeat protein
MADVPGELHERPWKSFEHNRNEALALASSRAGYLFFIDADETLSLPQGFVRPPLESDVYDITCEYAGYTYARCALVSSRMPWRWQGVVHEFLTCGEAFTRQTLVGPKVVIAHDGARSRDPQTYLKDAALLEESLREDPANARNLLYLAQSYRDAGQLARSRAVYLQRAAMGGWDEEAWFALYQVAVLTERLGAEPAEVAFAYLNAFQTRPSRAEPLLRLARYHRLRNEFALALLYARQAALLSRPADVLFVEDDVYRWQALDELSIAAYYVGAMEEGGRAMRELLAGAAYPASHAVRIATNGGFYGLRK